MKRKGTVTAQRMIAHDKNTITWVELNPKRGI